MSIEKVRAYFAGFDMEEMEKYSGFTAWVDVCKAWQE